MNSRKKIAVSINLDWPTEKHHDIFAGIESYAEEHTDWILIWDHFPEIVLSEKPDYYDGVVGRIDDAAIEKINELKLPAVNVWHNQQKKFSPNVVPDMTKLGEIAAEHLIKRGYKKLLHIGYGEQISTDDFHNGLLKIARPHSIPVDRKEILLLVDENIDEWPTFQKNFYKWISELEFPLGIATSDCALALKCISKLNEHSIKIPEQVGLITAGNDIVYCEKFRPTVTSIIQPQFEIGYKAAQTLHMKMQGLDFENQVYVPPPLKNIVPRESTDTYIVDDEDVRTALRYIAGNYENIIQVSDIIKNVDISRRTLEKRFTEEVGHSILTEINLLRVNAVKRQLRNTGKSLKQLSNDIGFSSDSHLIRVFKKHEGMTPDQYRKSTAK